MSNFQIDPGYVEVAERIQEFYQRFPTGRLDSEIVELSDVRVTVRARAYREPDDPVPATGHSWLAIPGSTPYTKGSELENAETSAIGRAIVMAGIPSKKVASADEVRAKKATPEKAAPARPAPAPLPHGGWAEGMKHDEEHKPLRARQNGSLFCPTKLQNGAWCPWKHDGAPPPEKARPAAPEASTAVPEEPEDLWR